MPIYSQFTDNFRHLEFKQEEPLSKYSQVKIGGPAEVFINLKDAHQMIGLIQFCLENNIDYHILGWGANTLIADRGLRGLVIKNSAQAIELLDYHQAALTEQELQPLDIAPRWESPYQVEQHSKFSELEQQEQTAERVLVRIDAGTPLPVAINQLASLGISGLQWYAKIPATIGGAIFNNIHGGQHYIGEVIATVEVIDREGQVKTLSRSELALDYDQSRFHTSEEIILTANFLLFKSPPEMIRQFSINWARDKASQPQKSLGCVFQNLSKKDQDRLKLSTSSVGSFIDHQLQLKGFQIGDAQVSPQHAAFIVNLGSATAKDYLSVIKHIQREAITKFQVFLKPEIFFLGFTQEELAGIVAPD